MNKARRRKPSNMYANTKNSKSEAKAISFIKTTPLTLKHVSNHEFMKYTNVHITQSSRVHEILSRNLDNNLVTRERHFPETILT